MLELLGEGSIHPILVEGGRYRIVQHVGSVNGRPLVVVLDVVRDDLPFPEELDGIAPLVVHGNLIHFALDDHFASEGLYRLPVRWIDPGKAATSIVRVAQLPERIAQWLASKPVRTQAKRKPSVERAKDRTLIDDDGVLVVTCLASVAAASDAYAYPDTLLAARARGELVFFETSDEGAFEIREVPRTEAHIHLGSLEVGAGWWIMPLSAFTMGFDASSPVRNAVRLSPPASRTAVYAARRGSVIELAYDEAGTPLGELIPRLSKRSSTRR